jgi:hypothetical protein
MVRIISLHVMADLHVFNPQISTAKIFPDEVLGKIFLLLSPVILLFGICTLLDSFPTVPE